MSLLRTAAYWLRFMLRPSSVSWTADDDYEFEWVCWEHEHENEEEL